VGVRRSVFCKFTRQLNVLPESNYSTAYHESSRRTYLLDEFPSVAFPSKGPEDIWSVGEGMIKSLRLLMLSSSNAQVQLYKKLDEASSGSCLHLQKMWKVKCIVIAAVAVQSTCLTERFWKVYGFYSEPGRIIHNGKVESSVWDSPTYDSGHLRLWRSQDVYLVSHRYWRA